MSSPDAWLYVRFERFIPSVHILVNGKYSSDDDISWGCSCWQAGTPLGTTADFQAEKDKCDVHIYDEPDHGHGTVFLL